MWNKKNETESRTRTQVPVSEPPTAPVSAPPPQAPPPPVFRAELPKYPALLGRTVVVRGQISSGEDLTIDGDVQGTIVMKDSRLTVGPGGKVQVDKVTAREVVVLGSLKGTVDASDKVLVKKDAQLVGDVQTAGIVIDDGAYFKGGIDIRKP